MYYFAFGANMNDRGMEYRCPDALKVAPLVLPDYRLVFRGVADVEPLKGAGVQGVLWDITEDCEANLDRFEGFPNLYRKEYFLVEIDGEAHEAMFYTMNRSGYGPPSYSYFDTIQEGYEQNGLPTDTLEAARTASKNQIRYTPLTKTRRRYVSNSYR